MIRTFHSIGQGAFYTEQFNGFTMVYDCGGNTQEIIQNEIRGTFQKGEKIDALFISHFHNDHINGLEFLLKYCNVQTIYLPLLHDNAKVQLIIENQRFGIGDQFVEGLIVSPGNIISQTSENKDIEIVFIEPHESDFIRIEDERATSMPSGQEVSLPALGSTKCEWVFVPYNLQYSTLNTSLVSALKADGINVNDMVSELKNKKKKIIRIYKTVLHGTKNFNMNSLVLYSGPIKSNECLVQSSYRNWDIPYLWHKPYEAGSLYLGDYNVSEQSIMDNLRRVYSTYWDFAGTVQMPHHGSKYNFHRELVKRGTIAIMSTGRFNRYRHPHAVTLKKLIMQKAIPIIVTEEMDTSFIQEVRTSK